MDNILQLSSIMTNTLDFFVGQRSSIEKVFDDEEVVLFSKISKDTNPIHIDGGYAADSRFRQRIVQGPFVQSLIGGILGSSLPGEGTIYLQQTTNFLKPVYLGEKITACVEVTEIRPDKPIVTLRTWVEKQNGEIVLDGEAVVMVLNK